MMDFTGSVLLVKTQQTFGLLGNEIESSRDWGTLYAMMPPKTTLLVLSDLNGHHTYPTETPLTIHLCCMSTRPRGSEMLLFCDFMPPLNARNGIDRSECLVSWKESFCPTVTGCWAVGKLLQQAETRDTFFSSATRQSQERGCITHKINLPCF